MQGCAVVPDDHDDFLPTSWRMEPGLTAMVSALSYGGRLGSNPGKLCQPHHLGANLPGRH